MVKTASQSRASHIGKGVFVALGEESKAHHPPNTADASAGGSNRGGPDEET